MKKRSKILIAGIAALAVAAGGVGVAVAGGGDDAEAPIHGDALDKASAAALEHTGAGRVTETEVGDEESYYEVEVTLDDGSQVDVQLDRGFDVVGGEADNENEDERGDDD
jgi:Peptidase propeptide and YPEB domain